MLILAFRTSRAGQHSFCEGQRPHTLSLVLLETPEFDEAHEGNCVTEKRKNETHVCISF